jgi:hypothetical protein
VILVLILSGGTGRSGPNPGKVEVPGDELAGGVDVAELKRKLELVKGDTTR